MPKYNVVIDTNIYRKNPARDELAFDALKTLCKADVLKLHIPHVVMREFQTQQTEIHEKELAGARKGLEAVLRKRLLSAAARDQVQAMLDTLGTVTPAVVSDVEAALPTWAADLKAQVHELTLQTAADGLDAYFRGLPPLKQPKSREDIPDAFIFQTIRQLAQEQAPLVVVAEDGKLADASKDLPHVQVFDKLQSFIESQDIQDELKMLDEKALFDHARAQVEALESAQHYLTAYVQTNAAEKLLWRKVKDYSIPDDNNEAVISMFSDADEVELEFDKIAEFGAGVLGLPFEFECQVSIIFYVFKSDYYLKDEHTYSVSDHNDHYFEAEAEVLVRATGMLRIELPQGFDKTKNLADMDEEVGLTVDGIDEVTLVDGLA
jgi:hypothetical protein